MMSGKGKLIKFVQQRILSKRLLCFSKLVQLRQASCKSLCLLLIIIIITRQKPAYGRQGLAGSWGQDTDEVSTFLEFLMSHLAPAALSSDLKNLGP